MGEVRELAERLETFDAKLKRILDNHGGSMTAGGQGIAIGMLVTLNLPIFAEAAAALRTTLNLEASNG